MCAFEGAEIVAEEGYGWADRAAGRKRDVTSINNIASVSKLFTATAVIQEVERGNLDLDVDVAECLTFPIRNPHHPETVGHSEARRYSPRKPRRRCCPRPADV